MLFGVENSEAVIRLQKPTLVPQIGLRLLKNVAMKAKFVNGEMSAAVESVHIASSASAKKGSGFAFLQTFVLGNPVAVIRIASLMRNAMRLMVYAVLDYDGA